MKLQFVLSGIFLLGMPGFAQQAPSQPSAAQQQALKAQEAQERDRVKEIDPPIKPDPWGNGIAGGLAGGAVIGAIEGGISGAAVGAAAGAARGTVTGTVVGTGTEVVKSEMNKANAPTPVPVAAAPAPSPAPQPRSSGVGPSGHPDPAGGAREIDHGTDKPDRNTPGGRDVSDIG